MTWSRGGRKEREWIETYSRVINKLEGDSYGGQRYEFLCTKTMHRCYRQVCLPSPTFTLSNIPPPSSSSSPFSPSSPSSPFSHSCPSYPFPPSPTSSPSSPSSSPGITICDQPLGERTHSSPPHGLGRSPNKCPPSPSPSPSPSCAPWRRRWWSCVGPPLSHCCL